MREQEQEASMREIVQGAPPKNSHILFYSNGLAYPLLKLHILFYSNHGNRPAIWHSLPDNRYIEFNIGRVRLIQKFSGPFLN